MSGLLERLDRAVTTAEELSNFRYHESYRPLFKRVWLAVDTAETGILSYQQAEQFTACMVESGWPDWEAKERDRDLWRALQERFGGITVEQVIQISENPDFNVPMETDTSAR